ncbi:MAG: transposase [Chloroflexi bacterium]|nr:transposase [Chloroflexota bacterium]MBI3340611.1 transposase [Chloroflexota bacterium]
MVKRRNFSGEFKARVVLELISGKKSLAEASREYSIKDSVPSRWKQEFVERAGEIFEQPKELPKLGTSLEKRAESQPSGARFVGRERSFDFCKRN